MPALRTAVIAAGVFGVAAGVAASVTASRFLNTRTAPAPKPPEHALSDEEERAKELRFHEELLRAHRAEPVDGPWADAQKGALAAALAPVAARGGAAVVDIECRTTSCVVTLRFPGYEAARASMARFLHPRVPGCGTETMLPEPVDAKAPYDAQVIYDCKRASEKP